jgi:hypothetical protein
MNFDREQNLCEIAGMQRPRIWSTGGSAFSDPGDKN